jgi:integrase
VLLDASIQKETVQKYTKQVTRFVHWGCDRGQDPDTPSALDTLLSDYFNWLYEKQMPKSWAKDTLSGVLFFSPHLRGSLALSARALKGWNILQPSVSYKPMTRQIAVGVAIELFRHGRCEAAVAVLLTFEGYLRNGEACNLRVTDVALPGDARLGSLTGVGGLRIAKAKGGREQWAILSDPLVVALLRTYISRLRHCEQLFPNLTSDKFLASLRRGLQWLGFAEPPYTIHSLRHGHATEDFLLGVSVETIMVKGRWQRLSTAKTYIQTGRSLLLTISLPRSVQARLLLYSDDPSLWFTASRFEWAGV